MYSVNIKVVVTYLQIKSTSFVNFTKMKGIILGKKGINRGQQNMNQFKAAYTMSY